MRHGEGGGKGVLVAAVAEVFKDLDGGAGDDAIAIKVLKVAFHGVGLARTRLPGEQAVSGQLNATVCRNFGEIP